MDQSRIHHPTILGFNDLYKQSFHSFFFFAYNGLNSHVLRVRVKANLHGAAVFTYNGCILLTTYIQHELRRVNQAYNSPVTIACKVERV